MSRFATSVTARTIGAAVALTAAAGLSLVLPASAHDTSGAGETVDASGGHAPTGARGQTSAGAVHGETLVFQGPLSDLQPTTTQALEGARATVRMTLGDGESALTLVVRGIDRAAGGTTYGAHLHSGSCVPGDGAAAGAHYNSATPPVVDADHEVWLDFTVTPGGTGRARAVVPFVPVHGARSVVIHELATNHDTGAAGARLACLPVVW
jgi:Cu-Zn family superoxide dismutase